MSFRVVFSKVSTGCQRGFKVFQSGVKEFPKGFARVSLVFPQSFTKEFTWFQRGANGVSTIVKRLNQGVKIVSSTFGIELQKKVSYWFEGVRVEGLRVQGFKGSGFFLGVKVFLEFKGGWSNQTPFGFRNPFETTSFW